MQVLLDSLIRFISQHLTATTILFFCLFAYSRIRKRKVQADTAKKILHKSISTNQNEPLTLHPEVDPALCAGCGNCTRVCPEGDILKLINHKAVLVSPTKCVGHGECEAACPTNAISLVFGTKTRGMDLPRITTDYETNVPGLYIAGELGGMGLIRNAVKQGFLAAAHALDHLGSQKNDVDLLIIGAGPAGLAASLTAISKKKKYICIEQNRFGGTVYNFPRQKVVMTHPADLPIVGKMKFKSNKVSKEELLEYWNEIRKTTGLKVQEETRFETLKAVDNGFEVQTNRGMIRASKVILGIGVRGTPRKLGLKNEDLPKVTYNLIDPEQYQSKNVVVVGGGNAGVESAQMLANPKYKNRVTLLVRGETFDRCNEENKRIIENMEKAKQLEIWFNSSVKEIQTDKIKIQKGADLQEINNDFIFVFAGAELPHQFLMSLGINMDKKFGEGRSVKI